MLVWFGNLVGAFGVVCLFDWLLVIYDSPFNFCVLFTYSVLVVSLTVVVGFD